MAIVEVTPNVLYKVTGAIQHGNGTHKNVRLSVHGGHVDLFVSDVEPITIGDMLLDTASIAGVRIMGGNGVPNYFCVIGESAAVYISNLPITAHADWRE